VITKTFNQLLSINIRFWESIQWWDWFSMQMLLYFMIWLIKETTRWSASLRSLQLTETGKIFLKTLDYLP